MRQTRESPLAAKKKATKKKAAPKKKAAAKKKPVAKKKAAPKNKAAAKKAPAKKKVKTLTKRNFKWNEGLVGRAAKRKGPFETMDEVEAKHIKSVLDAYGGDIQRTALALGIARSTVYRKMKRYKLS